MIHLSLPPETNTTTEGSGFRRNLSLRSKNVQMPLACFQRGTPLGCRWKGLVAGTNDWAFVQRVGKLAFPIQLKTTIYNCASVDGPNPRWQHTSRNLAKVTNLVRPNFCLQALTAEPKRFAKCLCQTWQWNGEENAHVSKRRVGLVKICLVVLVGFDKMYICIHRSGNIVQKSHIGGSDTIGMTMPGFYTQSDIQLVYIK